MSERHLHPVSAPRPARESPHAGGGRGAGRFPDAICWGCHRPIWAGDDDAGICIECGGRNRRRLLVFDDELAPARGIAIGVGLGLALLLIAAVVALVVVTS